MGSPVRHRAILLFGLPGSGKGTQGHALGSVPGYLHVASGDIFRQLNKLGQLGRLVDSYISNGKLVPDDVTVSIWRNHIGLMQRAGTYAPSFHTLVLDGIPRTLTQARLLTDDLDVRRIFHLKLRDPEEAVKRIRDRALKEGRKDDASDRVIRDRLQTFFRETTETLEYYNPEVVRDIDASRRPMAVLADLAADIHQSELVATT